MEDKKDEEKNQGINLTAMSSEGKESLLRDYKETDDDLEKGGEVTSVTAREIFTFENFK